MTRKKSNFWTIGKRLRILYRISRVFIHRKFEIPCDLHRTDVTIFHRYIIEMGSGRIIWMAKNANSHP